MPPPNRKSPKTTAVLIDAELCKTLDAVCEERMIGRRLLAERLIRDGLERLTPPQLEPAASNGAEPAPEPAPAEK